jgi:hypothetical protein
VYPEGVSILSLHPGLRLSAIGGVIFLVSLLSMLVLPHALSVAGMLVGGMGVWIGFLWTLFAWYVPSTGEHPEA